MGIEPRLEEGGRGEFSIVVGGQVVAKKGFIRFPSNKKVLAAVRLAVGA
jgi:hypothetical protein